MGDWDFFPLHMAHFTVMAHEDFLSLWVMIIAAMPCGLMRSSFYILYTKEKKNRRRKKKKSWCMLMAQRIRGKGFAGYYLEGAGVC